MGKEEQGGQWGRKGVGGRGVIRLLSGRIRAELYSAIFAGKYGHIPTSAFTRIIPTRIFNTLFLLGTVHGFSGKIHII